MALCQSILLIHSEEKAFIEVVNMARKESSHKKAASASMLIYGFPGKLLHKWEMELVDEGQELYRLHRENGSTRMIRMNDTIETNKGPCVVSKGENGTVKIGEHSVLIGRNLKHGFQARAMKKPLTFLLRCDKGRNLGTVSVGTKFNGKNVELIAGHLLKVGEDIFPITPKLQEIKLLVYKTPLENGYLAHINVLEPDNPQNNRDGSPGTFVPPASPQDPCMFYEEYAGHKVLTAQFWLEAGDKRLTFHSREGAVALEEIKLKKQLLTLLEEAVSVGIDPMEYHEYKVVHDQLDEISEKWIKGSMFVNDGAYILKPHNMRAVIQEGMGF